MKTPRKRFQLKDTMVRRILSGEYRYGERLPSGLRLAEELNTSYVTVNKTMKLLEEEGFISSKPGVGSFVTYRESEPPPPVKKVNLICPSAALEGLISSFLNDGQRIFSDAGWRVRTRMVHGALDEASAEIREDGYYTVLFAFRPHLEAFVQTLEPVRGRAVLIGERSDREGVASVTSDEAQAVRLCMKHFAAFGLDRATLVCANLKNEVEMVRAAGWRAVHLERGRPPAWCDRFCVDMEMPARGDPTERVERMFAKLEADGRLAETRAIIAPDPTVAVQLSHLLLARGVRQPEDVDIVTIGSSQLVEYYRPAISSIDPNFEGHLTAALGILERRAAGLPDGPLYHSCEPRLIERRAAESPARRTAAVPAYA